MRRWLKTLSTLIAALAWGMSALAQTAAAPVALPVAQPLVRLDALAKDEFRVTLLGTGSPTPALDRFGPGVLVQAGGESILIDAGRGVTQRLWQLGVPLGQVGSLLLTHLHSDHVVGIPDLWLTGWLDSPFGTRKEAMQVFGPPGTRKLMDGLRSAYQWDIDTRIADQNLPRAGADVAATEIKDNTVFERGGVKVTAFEVDHGDNIKDAFGYRIDFNSRSVVVSGDTRFNENLIKRATGVDLLIHQVAAARPALLDRAPHWRVILAHHTSPEQAGTVFTRAAPKFALYYHFVLLRDAVVLPPTIGEVIERTRTNYSGPLIAGEDLMTFRLTGAAVERLR